MAWTQYTWMIAVHGIVAWLDAYGIGANDVANSFGTSVGSKTLKMWSAVAIAAVFEFLGAMLLGGQVTKTVAGGIAKTKVCCLVLRALLHLHSYMRCRTQLANYCDVVAAAPQLATG
eukprot:GHRQ01034890.1.p2 GENE.GHRQ01034890.1~~GHRQ01034890.1.p2  ORF type:complete len:117 (+),score=19.12 GHRQ01034890.1:207-557(+)